MQISGNDDLTRQRELDHESASDSKPNLREGLPPTYRMRADPHYVEQLDVPMAGRVIQLVNVDSLVVRSEEPGVAIPALEASIRRHGVLQPLIVQRRNGETRLIDGRKRLDAARAAGLREVPCLVHIVDDGAAAATAEAANITLRDNSFLSSSPQEQAARGPEVDDAVIDAIAVIDSCTNFLSPPPSSFPHYVAVDLIRAELWRTSCLLKANRILRHRVDATHLRCSPRRVATEVGERAQPAQRLRGHALHVDIDVPENIWVAGDQPMLVTALSGLLIGTVAAAEGLTGVQVMITASVDATRQVEFAVLLVGVRASGSWETRVFDETWSDRPEGVFATVGMLAARNVAQASGGHVSAAVTARGTTAKMVLPVVAA